MSKKLIWVVVPAYGAEGGMPESLHETAQSLHKMYPDTTIEDFLWYDTPLKAGTRVNFYSHVCRDKKMSPYSTYYFAELCEVEETERCPYGHPTGNAVGDCLPGSCADR